MGAHRRVRHQCLPREEFESLLRRGEIKCGTLDFNGRLGTLTLS